MRGAAVSVMGNIAEGYGRNAIGDYIRYCEIARGSLAELGSYIEFSQERQLINSADVVKFLDLYNQNWNSLGALIRSLKKQKLDGNWDRSYTSIREDSETYNS
jgi:four helix bundle protein